MSATAVLASRADTPTRMAPVSSFSSAHRPVASSASSQRLQPRPQVVAADQRQFGQRCRRGVAVPSPLAQPCSPLPLRGERDRGGGNAPSSCSLPSPLPDPLPKWGEGHEGEGDSPLTPHQRNRLSRIADVVARHAEQLRVHLARHHVGERAPQGKRERQPIRQGRQRPAAVGIGRRAKVLLHQPQLGVAARRIGEPVEEIGEGFHSPSSSS